MTAFHRLFPHHGITHLVFPLFLLVLLLAACGQATPPAPVSTATPAAAATATAIASTPTPPATHTAAPTSTPANTLTPTASPTPASTATPAVTSTPVKLRGEVIVAQAVCHYGPGAPYLYKYGVYQGSNLEIIARDETSTYLEVQAIRGNNPCWVKGEYLKIKGSIQDLPLIRTEDARLPISPYYAPPKVVSAKRTGAVVKVFWQPFVLRPGDDSEQVPYLIEAWVCKGGQVVFTPLGAYETALNIPDEPGCAAPSHARFYAVEKHGYAGPLEIPWPQANAATPQTSATPTP